MKTIVPLILLGIFILVSTMPANAANFQTVAVIGNIPPAVENVESRVNVVLKDVLLEISVEASDINGMNDLDYVKVFLTNKENLGSNFSNTTWLNETILSFNKSLDGTTAVYDGIMLYPTYQPGDYYIEVQVFDKPGALDTWLDYSNPQIAFTLMAIVYYTNQSVTAIENVPTIIDAHPVNTKIEFVTKANATGSIKITRSISSISTPMGDPNPGVYLDIDASNELANFSWSLIKVGYNDAEVNALNIDENSLRLYWLNESSGEWIRLESAGSPPWVFGTGVDTVNNIVWANVSHFSKYAVGGKAYAPDPVINSNGGSGGSGSSGGGGSTGEDFKNIYISEIDRQFITKDSNVVHKFELEGNIVKYINFTALSNAGTIAAKVEMLNSLSSLVHIAPPDNIYKHLNIWLGNSGWANEKNIADTSVIFVVEKSWITDNDIDVSTIALHRYNGDKWEQLVTTKIKEDSTYLHFEAEIPGFSSFAVTGEQKKSKVLPIQIPALSTSDIASAKNVTTILEAEKTSNSTFGLLVLAIICVMVGIYLRKDHSRKGNQKKK
jgi:PGF-pre-PGF domain-containing protein